MRSIRRWLSLALIVALALTATGFHTGDTSPRYGSPSDGDRSVDVIITFRQRPETSHLSYLQGLGARVSRQYRNIPAVSASLPQSALTRLRQHTDVLAVEPDGTVTALETGPTAQAQTVPWGIAKVNAPAVHGFDKGAGVKVAIIDTGIDLEQLDLKVAGGVSFVTGVTSWDDDNGHGTHVAGTVAALDNDIGVVGVAPLASLFAVKVLNSSGSGSWSSVISGVDWAITNGMQVVSMSLGASSAPSAMQTAVQVASNAGIVIVAAAGNSGSSGLCCNVTYPAKFSEVIAVAAIDESNTRASFSSIGPEVELAAPGVGVLSTWPNNTYAILNGTSMATPHVSGLAALLIASGTLKDENADGKVNNLDVRLRMQKTATDLGDPGRDAWYGYGLINAAMAVAPGAVPTVPGAPTGVTATAGDAQATVSWNAPASDGGSAITAYTITSAPATTEKLVSGAQTAVVFTGLINGTSYTFTVKATNAVGTGPASAPSNAVVPGAALTVPGAPTGVTATAGNAQATVSWSAPASNGGSAITGYAVTGSPGGSCSVGNVVSCTVTGLTNGVTYIFTVKATNAVGTGPASAPSNAVTPTAPASSKMHIGDMSGVLLDQFRGWKTWAEVSVKVVDASGAPVAGVTVAGNWSSATTGSASATTGADGVARFSSAILRRPAAGTTFTFTVTDLGKSGYVYDPLADVKKSVSVIVV
ncbi:MAG: S8 family serine peptidase [Chloroflexi bacterium]|nr:S8 family serine peptidase [Chloroflexota bacterium]